MTFSILYDFIIFVILLAALLLINLENHVISRTTLGLQFTYVTHPEDWYLSFAIYPSFGIFMEVVITLKLTLKSVILKNKSKEIGINLGTSDYSGDGDNFSA